jgi:hypothetical protein
MASDLIPSLNIPFPDPSDRSSAQVIREVTILREILETRMAAIENSIRVSENRYLLIPVQIKDAVKGLEEVILEKFRGIDSRFNERDTRVIQSDIDAKLALKAALDSAEKAVVKAEAGMTKLTDGLAKRIDELRDSQKTSEGTKLGASEVKSDNNINHTLFVGAVGAIIAAIGVGVAIMVAVVAWNHTTPPMAPNYTAPIPMQPVQPVQPAQPAK